jgi:hypothetical protein
VRSARHFLNGVGIFKQFKFENTPPLCSWFRANSPNRFTPKPAQITTGSKHPLTLSNHLAAPLTIRRKSGTVNLSAMAL